MQLEKKDNYLYLYSGRQYMEKNPDITKVGEEDPFAKVQIIKIDSITGVEIDHKDQTVTLWCGTRPIYCSFGYRNCHRLNCFYAFLDVLIEAWPFDPQMVYSMKRRNSETALAIQRGDEMEENE